MEIAEDAAKGLVLQLSCYFGENEFITKNKSFRSLWHQSSI
jgi:hypothetical protein